MHFLIFRNLHRLGLCCFIVFINTIIPTFIICYTVENHISPEDLQEFLKMKTNETAASEETDLDYADIEVSISRLIIVKYLRKKSVAIS